MDEDRIGQGKAGGQKEGRPVDGMEFPDIPTQDVDSVRLTRPERSGFIPFMASKPGEIIGQGIELDVDNLGVVSGHRDAPSTGTFGAAGYTEIPQARPDEAEDFIAAGFRQDSETAGFQQALDLLLIGGESKEYVFFGYSDRFPLMDRASSVYEVLLQEEVFAARAVETLIVVRISVFL